MRCSKCYAGGNIICSIVNGTLTIWFIPRQVESKSKIDGKCFSNGLFQRKVDICVTLAVLVIITEHINFHFWCVGQPKVVWLHIVKCNPAVKRLKALLQ